MESSTGKKIVILGGGFGGVYTAAHLERLCPADCGVEITLISQSNYYLMTPLLFEAASGVVEPRHAVNPIRPMLQRTRFIEARAQRVDFEARRVHARHRSQSTTYEVPYDQLVIALGGVTNQQIIPGSEHALTFKTLADAIYLRNHVIDLFERADVEPDPLRRRALLTFLIVGAGLVGVELTGELTQFVRHVRRAYKNVAPSEIQFHLLEHGPRILPELDADLGNYVVEHYRKRGVRVSTSHGVDRFEPTCAHLPGGERIESHTMMLTVGVAPNPLLADFPLEKIKGRIATDAAMRSKSRPEVWALGDCAAIPDPTGKPYPMLAQHALREAKTLAKNLLAAFENRPLEPFTYKQLGTLAALGHFKGIGKIWGIKIRGFPAWWVWRTYYLMQMPRLDRKIRLMIDWTVSLLFKNDIVELDLFGAEHPHRTPPK